MGECELVNFMVGGNVVEIILLFSGLPVQIIKMSSMCLNHASMGLKWGVP